MSTPQPRSRLEQNLATGVAWLLFITVLQRGIGFFRSMLVCRWLDAEELGRWDLAFNFLMMVGPLVVLGLPGAFGRFVGKYRERGHLPAFVQATAGMCVLFAVTCSIALYLGQSWCGQFFFGHAEEGQIFALLVPALLCVVLFNYIVTLVSALRMHQAFAVLQAFQGVVFTVGCIALPPWLNYSAASIVYAYIISCVLTSIWGWMWLRRTLTDESPSASSSQASLATESLGEPAGAESFSIGELFKKTLPFAFWVWSATFVSNTFTMCDRLMLIHFGEFDEQTVLFLVGQYHAAQILPRLFVQFAYTLGGMLTPHLSQRWDQGDRDETVTRLGTTLKATSLVFTISGLAVLFFAPTLFGTLLGEKYLRAMEIMGWTLSAAFCLSLTVICQNALWCVHKAWLGTIAFAFGLVTNIAMNALLLPHFGFEGLVIGTMLGNVVALAMTFVFAARQQFRFEVHVYVLATLPCILCLGIRTAAAGIVAVSIAIIATQAFLTVREQSAMLQVVRRLRFSRTHVTI